MRYRKGNIRMVMRRIMGPDRKSPRRKERGEREIDE